MPLEDAEMELKVMPHFLNEFRIKHRTKLLENGLHFRRFRRQGNIIAGVWTERKCHPQETRLLWVAMRCLCSKGERGETAQLPDQVCSLRGSRNNDVFVSKLRNGFEIRRRRLCGAARSRITGKHKVFRRLVSGYGVELVFGAWRWRGRTKTPAGSELFTKETAAN